MVWFVIWVLVAVGVFLWNHFHGEPYLGIRFTDSLLGRPLSAGWLAAAVAAYCLVRTWVRHRRRTRPG